MVMGHVSDSRIATGNQEKAVWSDHEGEREHADQRIRARTPLRAAQTPRDEQDEVEDGVDGSDGSQIKCRNAIPSLASVRRKGAIVFVLRLRRS